VASRVGGMFVLANGILTFKNLAFDVRGASIRMTGTYALEPRAMNLSGQVRLVASASQTQTGFKSWVLKPFDPLFATREPARSSLSMYVARPTSPILGWMLRRR
jgi:hypothetical protein